jgi:hypothetical protein
MRAPLARSTREPRVHKRERSPQVVCATSDGRGDQPTLVRTGQVPEPYAASLAIYSAQSSLAIADVDIPADAERLASCRPAPRRTGPASRITRFRRSSSRPATSRALVWGSWPAASEPLAQRDRHAIVMARNESADGAPAGTRCSLCPMTPQLSGSCELSGLATHAWVNWRVRDDPPCGSLTRPSLRITARIEHAVMWLVPTRITRCGRWLAGADARGPTPRRHRYERPLRSVTWLQPAQEISAWRSFGMLPRSVPGA